MKNILLMALAITISSQNVVRSNYVGGTLNYPASTQDLYMPQAQVFVGDANSEKNLLNSQWSRKVAGGAAVAGAGLAAVGTAAAVGAGAYYGGKAAYKGIKKLTLSSWIRKIVSRIETFQELRTKFFEIEIKRSNGSVSQKKITSLSTSLDQKIAKFMNSLPLLSKYCIYKEVVAKEAAGSTADFFYAKANLTQPPVSGSAQISSTERASSKIPASLITYDDAYVTFFAELHKNETLPTKEQPAMITIPTPVTTSTSSVAKTAPAYRPKTTQRTHNTSR